MSEKPQFPQNWQIGQDYDPNTHLMKLERYDRKAQKMIGNDYLNVQNRLIWFIRDQRALIVAGLAKCPYVIETELVEHDRERGWAHYKTFIRDVLGNEATMYGSEAAASFPDYAEKASTKSLGRALLLLGYGTAFAPEMDEGEDVVDAPQETRTAENGPVTRQEAQQPTQSTQPVSQTTQPAAKKATKGPVHPSQIMQWLYKHGITTIPARQQLIEASGVKFRSDRDYTETEASQIVQYAMKREKEQVPA